MSKVMSIVLTKWKLLFPSSVEQQSFVSQFSMQSTKSHQTVKVL